MAALLDALRGRIATREANAHDTIAAGARAAARGESYDAGAVERALSETGTTLTDFERAVDLARRRHAWLADFDRLNAATARIKKLETAAAAEKAKMEAARTAFIERASVIDAELKTLRAACDRGNAARDNLLDPREVPPGTVGDKYRAAVNEAQAADVAVATAQREVRELAGRIKSESAWIAQLLNDDGGPPQIKPSALSAQTPAPPESPRVAEHRLALARAQRRKAEADAALGEAEKAAARAHKTVDALTLEVLKQ